MEGAKKALQRLRGKQDVEDELEEMASEKRKQDDDAETYNFKMFFKDKSNRLPLAATVSLQVGLSWLVSKLCKTFGVSGCHNYCGYA